MCERLHRQSSLLLPARVQLTKTSDLNILLIEIPYMLFFRNKSYSRTQDYDPARCGGLGGLNSAFT